MSYTVKFKDLGLKDYKEAWDYQRSLFDLLTESRKTGSGQERSVKEYLPGTLIFVEHPHVFTLGKHGSESNLLVDFIQLKAKNAAYYHTDRGGDITYHGPGQIVGYPVFDLAEAGISLKDYIYRLEEAIIRTIAFYGLKGGRVRGAAGVWIDSGPKDAPEKICAIGVKASRYITMHGFAFNVNTNLEYFSFINPCGITGKGVTSLAREMGKEQDIEAVKITLRDMIRELLDLKFIT